MPFFHQKNVDIIFALWYAEYVRAAVCRSFFLPGAGAGHKKEMTLDCSFFSNFLLQSRVISVHSYYLTSLVTSISADWTFP